MSTLVDVGDDNITLVKISDLPEATSTSDSDELVINQQGTTKRIKSSKISSGVKAWFYNALGGENRISPPYEFTSADVFRGGVLQYLENGSFSIENNDILFPAGDELEEGEEVLVRIGGQPVGSAPPSGTARVVKNIEELRKTDPQGIGEVITVLGYQREGIGGGSFYSIPTEGEQEDGGWTIRTNSGSFWRRMTNMNVVKLEDFGLLPGGNLDTPLVNAHKVCVKFIVAVIEIPTCDFYNPYILNGGVEMEIPMQGILLRAQGTYGSAAISHTGADNYGITFKQGSAPAALFAHTGCENIRGSGNVDNPKGFLRFQDTWGNYISEVWCSNYHKGAMITLENVKSWTENFKMRGVLSRANKVLLRTLKTTGTDSFYALTMEDVYHQFGVGNSRLLEAGTAESAVKIYGMRGDFGGWFESGGGHVAILANGASKIFGNLDSKLDGYGGIIDGSDMRMIRASSDLARVNLTMRTDNQQGFEIDLSSWDTAVPWGGVRHLLSSDTPDTVRDAQPIVRASGARIVAKQSAVNTDRVITINWLPSFTTWKARVTVDGPEVKSTEEYLISVDRLDYVAKVTNLSSVNGLPKNPKFCLRTNKQLEGGSLSPGNGNRVEWVTNAAGLSGPFTTTIELTME